MQTSRGGGAEEEKMGKVHIGGQGGKLKAKEGVEQRIGERLGERSGTHHQLHGIKQNHPHQFKAITPKITMVLAISAEEIELHMRSRK
ncbi:hypothetical protein Nepgr_018742 [Nepenthes gracilis]|uniref:Uncharacterized protein n=1 Tax=Nepenthes gracilis TaxID=150966 RepID=A0AAD3SU50_NEPGR|nr:hypothetical protein Nepgr_018742 [Nepenthes gracilis]